LEAEFLAGPQVSGLQLPTTLEEFAEHLGIISWLICPVELRPTIKPPCTD
jgi:hypothetical protein